MSEIGTHPALHRAKGMHPVRFELTHPKILELESSALDHSATNACFLSEKIYISRCCNCFSLSSLSHLHLPPYCTYSPQSNSIEILFRMAMGVVIRTPDVHHPQGPHMKTSRRHHLFMTFCWYAMNKACSSHLQTNGRDGCHRRRCAVRGGQIKAQIINPTPYKVMSSKQ